MLKKISQYVGTAFFFFGILGLAGAIENELSIIKPLVLAIIGYVLLMKGVKDEKTNSSRTCDNTRLWFLH